MESCEVVLKPFLSRFCEVVSDEAMAVALRQRVESVRLTGRAKSRMVLEPTAARTITLPMENTLGGFCRWMNDETFYAMAQ